ncbi:MAG: MinD/ParA family protein [Syntrophales bacterium]
MDQAATLRQAMERERERAKIPGKGGSHREDADADVRDKPVRVIAFTSGKGGVGKTNIAANIAYILSQRNRKTIVLDADMGLANIDLLLGLTPRYNLYHVLKGEKSLAETLVTGPGGMQVLPSSSGIAEMTELSRGQKLTLLDAVNSLENKPEFLLIDTAAGISGNVTYFNSSAHEIIVVTSAEPTALTDAYALMKVLYQGYDRKKFRLIVNMVNHPTEAREAYERLRHATDHFLTVTLDYLGFILHDSRLPEAVKKQKALAEMYPSSPASRCMQDIASRLCGEAPGGTEGGSIRFFSSRTIRSSRE